MNFLLIKSVIIIKNCYHVDDVKLSVSIKEDMMINTDQNPISKWKVFFIGVLFFVLDSVNQVLVLLIEVVKEVVPLISKGKEVSDSAMVSATSKAGYAWYGNVAQLAIIIFILYLLKRQGVNFFNSSKWSFRQVMITLGLGIASVLVTTVVDNVITIVQPQFDTENQLTLVKMFNNSGLITMFIMIVILAPIAEEIMTRGIFIGVLFKEKPYLGLIVSSVLFSLLHGPTDVLSFITYVVPGLTLGFIYIKTDRLVTPIIGHMLNNLLGFILLL